jgi:hypothetical protein
MDMQYSCGDFYFMLSMAVYGLNSCGLKWYFLTYIWKVLNFNVDQDLDYTDEVAVDIFGVFRQIFG